MNILSKTNALANEICIQICLRIMGKVFQLFFNKQDVIQDQLFSGVGLVWIQSFPSPRLVSKPRLNISVWLTISPIAGERIVGFISFFLFDFLFDWLPNQGKRTQSTLLFTTQLEWEETDWIIPFPSFPLWSKVDLLDRVCLKIYDLMDSKKGYPKSIPGDHTIESFIAIKLEVKLATVVEGNPKAPFSIATTPRYRGGHYSFCWIAPRYL